jgi:hypothetical protein
MATYDLWFQDGSGHGIPGIGVSIYGADVEDIEDATPITSGTTNAGGVLTGVELPTAYILYQFTSTNDDIPAGWFYAGSFPQVVVTSSNTSAPSLPPGYTGGK